MKKSIIRLFVLLLVFGSCSSDSDSEPVLEVKKYTLSISTTPSEGGTVSPSTGTYDEGKSVQLTGTPFTGYDFKEWTGGVTGTTNPISVTMDSNKNITGVFEKIPENPLYLDSNGVTIKCYDWAKVGDTGEINGITYMIVDNANVVRHDIDLSKICTTKVTDMSFLFSPQKTPNNFSFNGDISSWDVSNVTDMSGMFGRAEFNQDISFWDVSNVGDMRVMFFQSLFNQDIGVWNVSNVYDMGSMFSDSQFNQDISSWDVSSVTHMDGMFSYSLFNQDLGGWDVVNVTVCSSFSETNPQWVLPKPNFTNCTE